MKTLAFFGGIHPRDQKNAAIFIPIEPLPPPPQVVLPMPVHDGVPCRPTVIAGDYVTAGQKIADPPAAPAVHSPIAGRVSAIGPRVHPSGESVLSVVVDNDLSDALCPAVRPPANPDGLNTQQIIVLIRNAGVIGQSIRAVPTSEKILAGLHKVNTVIISACDSEPYIAAASRLLLERTKEILGGTRILAKLFGVDRVHIAVERGMRETIELVRSAIEEEKTPAVVDGLPIRYPQNAEKPLCQAVTGRKIPPGSSVSAIGCIVFDAAEAAAIYEAVYLGRPLTHTVVTVSGSGIVEPRNLLCPVGTPIRYLLDACGGVDPKTYKILLGGPMTGQPQYDMNAPTGKSDNAVLAFCKDEERTSAHPACIRCGRCISVCPMGLLPALLYQYHQEGRRDMLQKANVMDCVECGACSSVCPGRVPLVQAFRTVRQKINQTEI